MQNEKKHRAENTRKRKQPCRHAKNHTHIAVSAESNVLRHHFETATGRPAIEMVYIGM